MKFNTPFADLLPALSSAEKEALVADIAAHGVQVPIVVDEDCNVLDGHNRLSISGDPDQIPYRIQSGMTLAEKEAYVIKSNLTRRNLSPDQKKSIAKKQQKIAKALRKQNEKLYTQQAIADILGVDRSTVSRWFNGSASNVNVHITCTPDARIKIPARHKAVILARHEAGETQEQIAADYGVTRQRIAQLIKSEMQQQEAKIRRQAMIDEEHIDGIIHGDFRESELEKESVDLIFTDPPYDKTSIPLYADLAAFAAKVLKPGGWCLAYSGQAHLPDVLKGLTNHELLNYGWCMACIHGDSYSRFRNLKIRVSWKPILAVYKPPLDIYWDWLKDSASDKSEKTHHEWQQSLSEAIHFIDVMTVPNALIADPFCGSGTTYIAAQSIGRRCISYEKDIDRYGAALERIVQLKNETN